MKIPVIKRLNRGDVPGMPSWFIPVFDFLNTSIERIVQALTGRLSPLDNLQTQVKTVDITHNVELEISHDLVYLGANIIGMDNTTDTDKIVTGFKIRIVDNRKIGLTVTLAGAGTETSEIKLLIWGQ